jgi:hypothetical protein
MGHKKVNLPSPFWKKLNQRFCRHYLRFNGGCDIPANEVLLFCNWTKSLIIDVYELHGMIEPQNCFCRKSSSQKRVLFENLHLLKILKVI